MYIICKFHLYYQKIIKLIKQGILKYEISECKMYLNYLQEIQYCLYLPTNQMPQKLLKRCIDNN